MPLVADAIVVLGCAVRHGVPSAALARRVELAARAFEAGVAPRILASGGNRWCGASEASWIRSMLGQRLPDVAVDLEDRSRSTAENALLSAAWLRRHGATRVWIATCRWHIPRALAGFRACGIEAIAPPQEWIEGPAPSVVRRVREALATRVDAVRLQRALPPRLARS